MKKLLIKQLVCLYVLCFSGVGFTQGGQPLLESSVERQTVIDGESVLLYIKGENLQNLPDVSALSKEFDVLDSRRSNSQVIEGGVVKSQFLMRFELLPKNLGPTNIPSFTADGISTQPVTIEVVERGTPGAVPRDKVFAEVSLDKDRAYVQAQVVMSLHIFDDGSLASVDPPVPVIADVQVERLSGGDQRIEERDGEEFRVHTWRFALFPQKQGNIEIPRMLIPGSVRDPSYGGGLIMRSMATRRIQIRTGKLSFFAAPRADASTASWWLPAKDLQLQHQWSDDIATVTAGEPLTLTLALTSKGTTSNQLPEVNVPSVNGLKIYPDAPQLKSQPGDTGLISQRLEKWSVIPQREGQLSLPEINIRWWDTEADVEREATLPAQVLTVAADPNAVSEPPTQAQLPASTLFDGDLSDNARESSKPPMASLPDVDSGAVLWKIIAVFAICGWMITALCWIAAVIWKQRLFKPKPIENQVPEKLFAELKRTAMNNDCGLFRTQLMGWAHRQWPTQWFNGPVDVAEKLGNAELQSKLSEFEAAIYARDAEQPDLEGIIQLLQDTMKESKEQRSDVDLLPSL